MWVIDRVFLLTELKRYLYLPYVEKWKRENVRLPSVRPHYIFEEIKKRNGDPTLTRTMSIYRRYSICG